MKEFISQILDGLMVIGTVSLAAVFFLGMVVVPYIIPVGLVLIILHLIGVF